MTAQRSGAKAQAISTEDLPARMSAAEYVRLVTAQPHLLRSSKGRRVGGTRTGQSEEQLHRDCFAWVLEHEGQWPILKRMFHPANGGARSKGEGGKLKAMGVRPGVPDFLLPIPHGQWNGLAVELKAAAGGLSESQREWVADLIAARYVVGVARTLSEFTELVHRFIGFGAGGATAQLHASGCSP